MTSDFSPSPLFERVERARRRKRKFRDEQITLAHGSGGRAMHELIEGLFLEHFRNPLLEALEDQAVFEVGEGEGRARLAFTTDSYVVTPVFFPGGDIGRLAVCGTVNDLAMMGATDVLGLTCGVILEDGFPRTDLERILASMREACEEAGTTVVTGDTKVMGRGEIDGIVINTAGAALTSRLVRDNGLRPGDRIIVTGTIGDHGMAVMADRHGLELDVDLSSDVAPINSLIRAVLQGVPDAVTAMKDPTRGGVASSLHEMSAKSRVGIIVDERTLPVRQAARGVSELVGIDVLHVANEGKAVLGVRAGAADRVLAILRAHPRGIEAAIVGVCTGDHTGMVLLDTGFGRRIIAEPEGELLPRIC
jgi:hydrogenase expression/formation protein HypE